MKTRMLKVVATMFCLMINIVAFSDLAKFEVFVVDDKTENPVRDVEVVGTFIVNNGMLAWKGAADPNICRAKTDLDGRCTLRGKTNRGEAGCHIGIAPSGYYDNSDGWKCKFTGKNLLGVWQPDDLVVTLKLQRVECPIPLFVKQVGRHVPLNSHKDIFPSGEDVIWFDFLKGDWLPPVGEGEVGDVEFKRLPREDFGIGVNGAGITGESYRDSMSVRFVGEGNGLVEMPCIGCNALKIRTAPEDGYNEGYMCWDGYDRSMTRDCSYDRNRCFAFRIRTERDESGKITRAYYGKIYGDISFLYEYRPGGKSIPVSAVNMRYYLNPTPLDRNLEWNMHNLCKTPGDLHNPER